MQPPNQGYDLQRRVKRVRHTDKEDDGIEPVVAESECNDEE